MKLIKFFVIAGVLAIAGVAVFVGQLIIQPVINNPPQSLVRNVISFACPGAVYAFKTNENVVALTIDDGPDQRYGGENSTEKILDTLKDKHAKATFFIITEKLKERERNGSPDSTTVRIVEEGHELGNHLTRNEASILLGNRFSGNLRTAGMDLHKYLNNEDLNSDAKIRWVRPGVGWCTAKMQADIALTGEYEPAVLGSVWPYDTWGGVGPEYITDFVTRNVHPGSIIILHDGGKEGNRGDDTAKALPILLASLTQEGYQVTTLSDLLERGSEPLYSAEAPPAIIDIFLREWPLYAFERGRLLFTRPEKHLRADGKLLQRVTVLLLWAIASVLMVTIGRYGSSPFLTYQKPSGDNGLDRFKDLVRVFLIPAGIEELVMRGLLLPSAFELSGGLTAIYLNQFFVSTAIYVAYHPLFFGPLIDAGNILRGKRTHFTKTFWHPTFLVLVTILGASCALSYLIIGSILAPILFHGVVVWVWLTFLGGESMLRPKSSLSKPLAA
ncbi:MAG: polysaccharide deacetylase family protein [Pseudanabaenales cyanobacterium]|nr:polysaccharide deacetylase family protein [Pseudanabaenales cyanobacterium]